MSLPLSIVLVRPRYPGNIGASARAMKTMGAERLILVAPLDFPHREAEFRAAAARDVVANARIVATLTEALDDCDLVVGTSARRRHLALPMSTIGTFAERLPQYHFHRLAVVFGAEDCGLNEEEMLHCHEHIYIPASPQYPVLNLAHAVQIVCYELAQHSALVASPRKDKADHYAWPEASNPDTRYATAEESAHFYAHLERLLITSGFLNPARPLRIMPKLRYLFQRCRLQHHEVQLLRGILTQWEKTKRSSLPSDDKKLQMT